MTSTIAPLSTSYTEARSVFLDAARAAGAELSSTDHPLTGPDGELLATDVAWLGPHDATSVLLVVSATHGVEGYCGSALQRQWLEAHAGDRPADLAVVMIHALNPFGFAWVRRVNEDNVDLNRNFIDWDAAAPDTPDYDRIARILVPEDWSAETQAATLTALLEVAGEVGFERMQQIVSGGQYRDPKGLFYGGAGPVWSHRWLREWSSRHLARVERLTILDLHTGLGPWGHGELIGHEPGTSPGHQRASALLGEVHSMVDGDSVSAALSGDWLAASGALAPLADVVAVALEFGTVDTIAVMQALRADAWLHGFGNPLGPAAAGVRAQVRAAFADDDPAWIAAVWSRFAEVMSRALAR